MNYNPEIFRAYDIRGVYGKDFGNDFAEALGKALAETLPAKHYLISHDDRNSSRTLAQALIDGLTSAGVDVEYIGHATTPFFNFALNRQLSGLKAVDGGVMLTASHNSANYGGFKIFGQDGRLINLGSGLEKVKAVITKNVFIDPAKPGTINRVGKTEILKKYISFAIKKSNITETEAESVKIGFEGSAAVWEEIDELAKNLKIRNNQVAPDVTFALDHDADRLMIYNSAGRQMRPDFVLGLLVKDRVKFLSKPRVVYDLRFSRGVVRKLQEWGAVAFPSKVGKRFVATEMKNRRADLGGELSGHIYFKEANYNELPLLAMLRIVKILARSGMKLDELIKPFQTWYNSGEVNISGYANGVFSILKQKYPDGEIEELDGVTIKYPDWWFNVRQSNTEPLLRLSVEAQSPELLKEKTDSLLQILKNTG